ncbi:MAG: helix-turn-helix transcriptional regulator [Lentisphaerae bacterium]|nr:helix-turn-helix transcriptional regulator [Lentisphaerota bacterium]
MPKLSQRLMTEVGRTYYRSYGIRPRFIDLAGRVRLGDDPWAGVGAVRRKRSVALQESVNAGAASVFSPVPGLRAWVVALEDRRMVHGAVMGGEVAAEDRAGTVEERAAELGERGLTRAEARRLARRLPVWSEARIREAGRGLMETFYRISGWQPELMDENRLRLQQQQQINRAVEDLRNNGQNALYTFEKERALLAHTRAGDRNEARRILNEMLAAIYMSSPQLVVLRARTIELMTCLTRAAIEDNPLMEPLIERNHTYTERVIAARSFEDLSTALMEALDDFIDGIYLHGVNRSNQKVRRALDFISAHFRQRISLRTVAEAVGLSPCRLAHLVKDLTGRTVSQIIQEVRVRHGQQLLDRTDRSCARIAYEVGFGDQSYFIKHFKRLTGTTPGRYRRARQGRLRGKERV